MGPGFFLGQRELKASQGRDALESDVFALTVGNAFANSQFIREKTSYFPEIMLSYFGQYFTVENRHGKRVIVPHDSEGKPIFSRNPERQNEYATGNLRDVVFE